MLKISILTPIYGVEKYIEQCARSLFEQSYASIEYIFVDDCTPDKSIGILESLLKEYPERAQQVVADAIEYVAAVFAALVARVP